MISVERAGAPAALTPRSYNHPDVLAELEVIFHGKCYLCEGRGELQVEHLRPASAFPEKKFEWENLFPAHGATCNGRRIHWKTRDNALQRDGEPVRWPREGMLDCTKDDVESRLRQWLVPKVNNDIDVHFQPRSMDDLVARNTAWELQYIHMNRDDGSSARPSRNGERRASKLRGAIHARWRFVSEKLNEVTKAYIDGSDENSEVYRARAAEFRALLSDTEPYAALIRGTLRHRDLVPERLREDLLP